MPLRIPVRAVMVDGAADEEATNERLVQLAEMIEPRARGALTFCLTSEHTPDDVIDDIVGGPDLGGQVPRVLVGMCSGSDVKAATAFDLIAAVMKAQGQGVEVHALNAAGSNYELNLNNLARVALANDFDALMLLDADMRFPASVIVDLMAHNKDVVGATYRNRGGEHEVMGFELRSPDEEERGVVPPPIDHTNGALREVAVLPGGCLLIKRGVLVDAADKDGKVFRKIGADGTADYAFCTSARRLGFSVWYDPALSRRVRHIGEIELAL